MVKTVRMDVSVLGRFHGFNLSRELLRYGALGRLLTSYPGAVVGRWGIPRERRACCPPIEIASRASNWLSSRLGGRATAQFAVHEAFDRWVRNKLREGSHVFVGWSSSALHSLRRAKHLGMKTVLERGSTHIAFQTRILTEEYGRRGLRFGATHPAIIDKEIREYQEADYISVPTSFVAKTFMDRGVPASKLLITPYGVDLSQFRPEPREDRRFRAIYCGGVTLRKGILYLLEALKGLDVELWCVGAVDPTIRPQLGGTGSERVVFHGHQPQERLRWFYSQCDLFVLPSLEEGLAQVTLQAMACGLPVVVTPNTGIGDVIQEGREGYLVPPAAVDPLRDRIDWLRRHPEACLAMGKAAIETARRSLNWEVYGRKMLAHYRRILGLGDGA